MNYHPNIKMLIDRKHSIIIETYVSKSGLGPQHKSRDSFQQGPGNFQILPQRNIPGDFHSWLFMTEKCLDSLGPGSHLTAVMQRPQKVSPRIILLNV